MGILGMTDITQGQDAPAPVAAQPDMPDAHDVFPDKLPDADEVFPEPKRVFFYLSKFCRTILFKMLHRSRHALGGCMVANPRSFG